MNLPDLNPDWREQRACRTTDPAVFFPDEDRPDLVQTAVGICADCPVADQCLRYALVNDERHGVWGGKTADARRRIRVEMRRQGLLPKILRSSPTQPPAQCGSDSGYRKHVREKSKVCTACLDAHRRSSRAKVPRTEPTVRPTCGSNAGYVAHHRAGEVACTPCLLEHRKATYASARRVARRTLGA